MIHPTMPLPPTPPTSDASAAAGQSTLSCLRTVTAILLAMAFVVLAIPALLALGFERTFYRPETYKQVLNEQQFYQRFPDVVGEVLTNPNLTGDSIPPQLQSLSVGDYRTIVSPLMPPEWLRSVSERTIDETLGFINSTAQSSTAKIPLEGLNQRVAGEPGLNAVRTVIKSWPPCTTDELVDWGVGAFNGDLQNVPVCAPPAESMELIEPGIRASLETGVSAIPAEFDLGTPLTTLATPMIDSETGLSGPSLLATLRQIRSTAQISWVPALVFLGLLGLVMLGSIKRMCGWLGWTLLITGVLGGVTAAMIALLTSGEQIRGLLNRPTEEVAIIQQVIGEVFVGVVRAYAFEVAISAGVMLLVGIVLLIVSRFVERQPDIVMR
jgi:hypothetical protein